MKSIRTTFAFQIAFAFSMMIVFFTAGIFISSSATHELTMKADGDAASAHHAQGEDHRQPRTHLFAQNA